MNRTTWLQDRRMQKFRDVLSRWESGGLSMMEAGELLGMSERQFRRYRDRYEEAGMEGLRDRRLGGFKFRRQYAIDRFIADFCCASCKLIVEVDGPSHAEQLEYDALRTEWLERHGYHILRVSNDDVFIHIGRVLDAILTECNRLAGAEPHDAAAENTEDSDPSTA